MRLLGKALALGALTVGTAFVPARGQAGEEPCFVCWGACLTQQQQNAKCVDFCGGGNSQGCFVECTAADESFWAYGWNCAPPQ